MDHSLIPRVQLAEVDFLEVLIGNESEVERFANGWDSLATEIQSGIQSKPLDEPTTQTICAVADRISIISENYLQYRTEVEALASDFMFQLEQTFSNITLEDSSPTTVPESSPYASASYIEFCYHWLLQNLHNPYPSKKTKEAIARQTGSSTKDIDSWFVETRRRIGWNALRRSRFFNKRQSIVEAASRFFGKSDDTTPLAPALEVEFVNIQSQAEDLCRNKFPEQPSLLQCHITNQRESSGSRKRRCPPSQPSNTIPTSSCLCLPDSFGRALHASEPKVTVDTIDPGSRASMTPSQSSCSSPASYMEWLNDSLLVSTHASSSDSHHSAPTSSLLKRKRRLSISEGFDVPKRSRASCSDTRPHAVSDPLPLNNSPISLSPESPFDGTDLPSSLEVGLFDPSELFGLENDTLASSSRLLDPANQAIGTSTQRPVVQSQRKAIATSDTLYNSCVVSVVDNAGFGDQILPSNGLPYLDISLDGLPEPLDWLTPFLDETTINRLLEPNSTFQLDFPSNNDILSVDFPLSSQVY